MGLQITWFVIIAFFWTGFFILEGFDLGVGSLHMLVGKTDLERRVAINSIGPFWDGNEVWLIVAGAGMFAAFSAWYASMFSALYLALMVILLCLIIRGVSFEYRGKKPRYSKETPRMIKHRRITMRARYRAENMDAYQAENAANMPAPATMSHTSLPSQNGPMLLMATRRSRSVLPTSI